MFGESLPGWWPTTLLLPIGGSGYGRSTPLYLLAQRSFVAGRTGSVFAFAPFIGAVSAFGLGERPAAWSLLLGGALMLLGVGPRLAEPHEREHTHAALDDEHAHAHAHNP